MTLKVKDQIEVALSFNGLSFPLSAQGFYNIAVFNSTETNAPTISMQIIDKYGFFTEQTAVSSGSPIGIVIGDANSFPFTGSFRITTIKQANRSANETTWDIQGVLDAPSYLQDKGDKPLPKMTSTEAIAALASRFGFSPITHFTNDRQNWLPPPHQSFAKWMQDISLHGYSDPTSIMAMCLRDTRELVYKNLTLTMLEGAVNVFSHGGSGGIQMIDYQIEDLMGDTNTTLNHSASIMQQKLDGSLFKATNFNIPMLSSFLGMNSGEKGMLSMVRKIYAPPDVGNTHDNFQQAKYQNARGRASFQYKITFLIKQQSSAHLMDMITIQVFNPNTGRLTNFSGKYMVTKKNRIASGDGHYYEQFEASSQGPNVDPTGSFMSPVTTKPATTTPTTAPTSTPTPSSNAFDGF